MPGPGDTYGAPAPGSPEPSVATECSGDLGTGIKHSWGVIMKKLAMFVIFVAAVGAFAGNAASEAISEASDNRDNRIEQAIGQ